MRVLGEKVFRGSPVVKTVADGENLVDVVGHGPCPYFLARTSTPAQASTHLTMVVKS